jgi:DNA anti-recombination protein RmuC
MTEATDRLVERLRAWAFPLHPDDDRNSRVNPAGPEAADLIQSLTQQVETLTAERNALREQVSAKDAYLAKIEKSVARLERAVRDTFGAALKETNHAS